MTRDQIAALWLQRVDRARRPIYHAIVDALAAAIAGGDLQAGEQLPPQRTVAQSLGVDLTTVTRAYGLARERGLVEGAVGRGTFVRRRPADDEIGLVDLGMNLPPPPDGLSLGALLSETTRAVLQRTDAATLMAYHPGAGSPAQKAAGAAWIAPAYQLPPDRILVAPGAQTALAAVLSSVAKPGDVVVCEALTYPGLAAAARQLGLTLVPCPSDAEGPRPEPLARLCVEQRPAAVYLCPTMQNPTAVTYGEARRRDIAQVVADHGVLLIEDDPYSRLLETPPQAITSFAPLSGVYIATLAKALTPGLRTAFVAAPPGSLGERIAESLRAFSMMAAPLMTAVAASWIREGDAERLLAGVRREAQARRAIAAELLPDARGAAESLHVWLDLPDDVSPERLAAAAHGKGLALVNARAFAVSDDHPNGLRISLGAAPRRGGLQGALKTLASLTSDLPRERRLVV